MSVHPILLQMKYARVIALFAEKVGITKREALDFFYHSKEREMLRDGVSYLRGLSDDYLAEDLREQYEAENH